METRRRLQNLKCDETGDIHSHLAKLVKLKEELANTGAQISDPDFTTIIVNSLPSSYNHISTSLYTASRILKTPMNPIDILAVIEEEYEYRKVQNGGHTNALSARSGKNKRGKKGNSDRPRCSNPKCGKLGHKVEDCWKEGGGKEGQGPRQKERVTEDKDKKNVQGKAAVEKKDNASHAFTATTKIFAACQTNRLEIFDSGASAHISPYKNSFVNLTLFSDHEKDLHTILTADNGMIQAIGKGDLAIHIPNGEKLTEVILKDTLYAPTMNFTLVSLSQADKNGYLTVIADGALELLDRKSGERIARISESNGIWMSHSKTSSPRSTALTMMTTQDLHRKLAHISPSAVLKLVSKGKITGVELTDKSTDEFCKVCAQAKIKQIPFPSERTNPALEIGHTIHSDVWGPAPILAIGNLKYWCLFIDEYSRWGEIHFLRSKSDILKNYKSIDMQLETQRGIRIKRLQSDRGGEYMSNEFKTYLESRGTLQLLTVHDSPALNGIAEQCNGIC